MNDRMNHVLNSLDTLMSKGMQIKFNHKQTVSKIDFYGLINYTSIYI